MYDTSFATYLNLCGEFPFDFIDAYFLDLFLYLILLKALIYCFYSAFSKPKTPLRERPEFDRDIDLWRRLFTGLSQVGFADFFRTDKRSHSGEETPDIAYDAFLLAKISDKNGLDLNKEYSPTPIPPPSLRTFLKLIHPVTLSEYMYKLYLSGHIHTTIISIFFILGIPK